MKNRKSKLTKKNLGILLMLGVLALSNTALADGSNSVKYGKNNSPKNKSCVTLGIDNEAGDDSGSHYDWYASAIGVKNAAVGRFSQALGFHNSADQEYSIAIGISNSTPGYRGLAVGLKNKANTRYSVAMGRINEVHRASGVALGNINITYGESSVSVGNGNITGKEGLNSLGKFSSAIGHENQAIGLSSHAFGHKNISNGTATVALGNGNNISGSYNMAVGCFNSTAKNTTENFILGNRVSITPDEEDGIIKGSVALGEASEVKNSYVVSVGSSALKRRIVNVQEGIRDYDAVNIKQYKNAESINAAQWKKALNLSKDFSKALSNYYTKTETANGFVSKADGAAFATKSDVSSTYLTKSDAGSIYATKAEHADATGINVTNWKNALGIVEAPVDTNKIYGKDAMAWGQSNTVGSKTGNPAKDAYSVAIGNNNEVVKMKASALGNNNTAKGNYSLVAGYYNRATEEKTSAVGSSNNVEGAYSSAFGSSNNVSGLMATASGYKNKLVGDRNSAFGAQNDVRGIGNVVVGNDNVVIDETDNNYIFGKGIQVGRDAEGYGIRNSVALGTASELKESNVVSVGSSAVQRRIVNVRKGVNDNDAVNVIQFKSAENINATDWKNALNLSKDISEALADYYSKTEMDTGFVSKADGAAFATKAEHADATGINVTNWKNALGIVEAAADTNRVYGENAIAWGKGNSVGFSGENPKKVGADSIAVGRSNVVSGCNSLVVGIANQVQGDFGKAFGRQNSIEASSSAAFGNNNKLYGNESLAVGAFNTTGSATGDPEKDGMESVAIGVSNEVTKENALAVGYDNNVKASCSLAAGYLNTVTGEMASGVGAVNNVSGPMASTFGYQNTLTGEKSAAFGAENNVKGTGNIVVGNANVLEDNTVDNYIFGKGIQVGQDADGNAIRNSIALGNASELKESNIVSVGSPTVLRRIVNVGRGVNDNDAVTMLQHKNAFDIDKAKWKKALGVNEGGSGGSGSGSADLSDYYTKTEVDDNFISKTDVSSTYLKKSDAESTYATKAEHADATGINVTNWKNALGIVEAAADTNRVYGENAIAWGDNNYIGSFSEPQKSADSIAVGSGNIIKGANSTAWGIGNDVKGDFGRAFGRQNSVTARSATALGICNTLYGDAGLALGAYNIIGSKTGNPKVEGNDSLAVGRSNEVTKYRAAALGYNNTVKGNYSLAVGYTNSATAEEASAVGYANKANAAYSSAFGYNNNVSGLTASVFGYKNTLTGEKSAAFGAENNVKGTGNIVIGNANVLEDNTAYNCIFGKGIQVGQDADGNAIRNSIALGNASELKETNIVSVGSSTILRRIVNVGRGVNDNDAVTMLQHKNAFDIDKAKWKKALGVNEGGSGGSGSGGSGSGSADLSDYYTKMETDDNFISKTDVSSTYLKKSDAESIYATKSDVSSNYLKKVDAESTYATKSDVSGNYLKKVDAESTYATKSDVSSTYLKKIDAESIYATKSDVSSTYLTKSDAGSTYLTKSDAGSIYATKAQLGDYYTKTEADEGFVSKADASAFATKSDIKNTYISKSDVAGTFTTKEDHKDAGDINTASWQKALGIQHISLNQNGTAVGFNNGVIGKNSSAIGINNEVYAGSSVAIGYGNRIAAGADNNYILGGQVTIGSMTRSLPVTDSVVLGHGSTVTESKVVSVGSAASRRKIVNLAKGVNEYDAINMLQYRNASDIDKAKWKHALGITDGGSGSSGSGGSVSVDLSDYYTKMETDNGFVSKTEANSSFIGKTAYTKATGINVADWKNALGITDAGSGTGGSGSGSSSGGVPVDLSDYYNKGQVDGKLNLKVDKSEFNTSMSDINGKLDLKVDKSEFNTSMSDINGKLDLKVDKTEFTSSMKKVDDKLAEKTDKKDFEAYKNLTDDTLKDHGDRITELENSPGGLPPKLVQNIKDNSVQINKLDNKINDVGSLSAALAGLHPMQYDPAHPNQMMAAVGAYKDSKALAFGGTHYFNEKTMMTLGFSMGLDSGHSEFMGNLGVTWKLGPSGKDYKIPVRYNGRQMESVYMMQIDMESVMQENRALKQLVAEQDGKIKELMERLAKIEDCLAKCD